MTEIRLNATARARFEAKVDRSGDGCHTWTARTDEDGYGHFRPGGGDTHDTGAHRVAWVLAEGPIPDGLHVLHRCDNPPCVRREHLFLGTTVENTADRDAKGRTARGDRSGARVHRDRMPRGARSGRHTHPERTARGERQGSAKLTEDTVRAIRREYAAGGVRQVDLAAKYGIRQTTVSGIIRRTGWAHVEDHESSSSP